MKQNKHHKEILTSIKPKDTMRVYVYNIKGGIKQDGWSKYGFVVKRLKEMEVNVIGLAETNIP
eukprot:660276-Ditylum_brightwellii.AAC.1